MKPLWLGVFFLFLYGLFSMKVQAAEDVFVANTVCDRSDVRGFLPEQAR
jgi:hypothetical protein